MNASPDPKHDIWLTPLDGAGADMQIKRVVDHMVQRNSMHEPSFRIFELLREPEYQAGGGEAPLCLDLGANQGHSVISLHKVCPRLRVISFEPLPWCVQSLAYLKRLNPFNSAFSFEFHGLGVGDADAQVDLWAPGSDSHVLTTQASLDPSRAQSEATRSYMQMFFTSPLEKVTAHRFTIAITRLDNYGFRPAAIKMDVEENELRVIAGAQATIAANKPILLIETGPLITQIAEKLAGYGYQRFLYDDEVQRFVRYGARPLKGNTVFLQAHQQGMALRTGLLEA